MAVTQPVDRQVIHHLHHAVQFVLALDALVFQGKSTPRQQPQPQFPLAHSRHPVRLQKHDCGQEVLSHAAPLIGHLVELLRQDWNWKSLRIHPLMDGPLLELIHDVSDADVARALHRARVAGCAQPDGHTRQNLLLEIRAGHRHHLARRVVHVDAQRAHPGTRATLNTALQLLAARHTHDFPPKPFNPVCLVFDRAYDFDHNSTVWRPIGQSRPLGFPRISLLDSRKRKCGLTAFC